MTADALTAVLNSGNSLLTKAADGRVGGLPLQVAGFIATQTGRTLRTRLVAGTAAVVDELASGAAEIGFLAADPSRSALVAFTRPFIRMEATYLLRSGEEMQCADVDRAGARVGVLANSGPELMLRRQLRCAALRRFDTVEACVVALRQGVLSAAAGLRHSLTPHAALHPGLQTAEDGFGFIEQCVCVARAHNDRIGPLNALLRRFAES